MGAPCAVWGPYGSQHLLYGSCMCHMGAILEPYGRSMAPHRGNMRHMGATWELCMLWEPCALNGSHMAPIERKRVPYEAPMHCMGAACTTWEPHAPYVGHMGAMCALWEAEGPIWELWAGHGSHV
jgi:hypothetical protein